MALNYHRAIQVRNGVSEGIDDAVVIEDRFRIFFNDYPVAESQPAPGARCGFCYYGRDYPMR